MNWNSLNPSAGGISGAITKKTLLRKKKNIAMRYALNGGSQSYFHSDVCRRSRPRETNMLISASPCEDMLSMNR